MNAVQNRRVYRAKQRTEAGSGKKRMEKRTQGRMAGRMERHGEFPEGTIRDTLDNLPMVVTLLVLANVAAAAAVGRGTYALVKRARARSTTAADH